MTETSTRGRGRPRGFEKEPDEFENRFQKFYYTHRERLNVDRRELYQARKRNRRCVRCGKRSTPRSVFCRYHLAKTRKQLE